MNARTALTALALLSALVAAPAARAEDPFAKWQPRSKSQPSTSSNAVGPIDDQPPVVQFLALMGFDKGLTEIVEVVFDDGSTQSLYFNGGMAFSGGALFLPLMEGRLQTQATIGVQGWNITAKNAVTGETEDIRWFAVPVEVMEFANLGFLRVGAGLSYLVNPSVKGKGPELGVAKFQFDFNGSPGLVVEADFTGVNSNHSRKPRYWLGVRYRLHSLVDQYGERFSGNSFGFVMGLAY